ncbi:TBC1 domain family member 5 [Trichostrongylus colubriformis]|uniref:TBC1 domain family member 5 n=1 Tax=Trichostrongylus colubriformis TaxID=6319 RepID=A0AAN8IR47_TRICO
MEESPRREAGGNEYASILSDQLTLDILRNFCLRGGLRTSTLRSIAWRIHLKCLPISKVEWITVTTRARELYASLKQKNIPNPHDDRFCQDPQINNPLDQTDHNPWQQYFADHDLRDLILKDVGRTFPELEFFQQEHIRRMMCDILLIYAKENPFVSYKQGMHEVLAPLMFVLFCDQQSFSHCLETGGLSMLSDEDRSILSHVYDPNHLESDSYGMFCEIMLEVTKWYEDGSQQASTPKPFNESGPFMRVQDGAPTNQVMRELAAIGERLHSVDPVLAAHLNSLDIPPQLYGIRWLRLLFGREFSIHDLLYVWDVLLCDRPIARMVECIFLAMLVQIRHLLLQSDYGGCLQYLMRYPPIVDVSSFIQQALHYRNPKKYAKPASINSLGNFTHMTVTGAEHPNRFRQGAVVNNDMGQDETSGSLRNITSTMLSKVKNSVLERPSLITASPPLTPRRGTQGVTKSPSWEKELRLMEEQVACLQSRLNEKDVACLEAARNIESCVAQLRNCDRDGIAGVCTKLMEISSNLTASTENGAGDPTPSRRNADQVLERQSSFHRAPPQPRHIQRENEMVDLKLWMTK